MKVKIQGFINYQKRQWDDQEYFFHPYEMVDHGYVTVMPYEIEADIPDDWNPVSKQLEMLDALEGAARQKFADEMLKISQARSNLLAITNDTKEK